MLESNKIYHILTYCYPIMVPMRNSIAFYFYGAELDPGIFATVTFYSFTLTLVSELFVHKALRWVT